MDLKLFLGEKIMQRLTAFVSAKQVKNWQTGELFKFDIKAKYYYELISKEYFDEENTRIVFKKLSKLSWKHWRQAYYDKKFDLEEKGYYIYSARDNKTDKRNKRYWLHLGRRKNINLELNKGSYPCFYLLLGSDEYQIAFHVGLYYGIYLSFQGFFMKFFKKYFNKWDSARQIRFSFSREDYAINWGLWVDPHRWSNKIPKWRSGHFSFKNVYKGKHTCKWEELKREQFTINNFSEKTYHAEVIQKKRIDSYSRFYIKDDVNIVYEIEFGFYDEEGKWVGDPILHEGKGENSWDQGEDGTWSISFGTHYKFNNCQEALEKAVQDCQKTRVKYGGENWIPEKYREGIL